MTDTLYRHFLTMLFTLVLGCMFWGGYVAGANGWPIVWFVLVPIYAFIFNRLSD